MDLERSCLHLFLQDVSAFLQCLGVTSTQCQQILCRQVPPITDNGAALSAWQIANPDCVPDRNKEFLGATRKSVSTAVKKMFNQASCEEVFGCLKKVVQETEEQHGAAAEDERTMKGGQAYLDAVSSVGNIAGSNNVDRKAIKDAAGETVSNANDVNKDGKAGKIADQVSGFLALHVAVAALT